MGIGAVISKGLLKETGSVYLETLIVLTIVHITVLVMTAER